MGQVKIYGLKENIDKRRKLISDVLHFCIVEVFKYPEEKRFHRFFNMEKENFYFSPEKTEDYLIVEISIFEGRSKEIKRDLIYKIFKEFEDKVGISKEDIEITIFETPMENWGIRGKPGDELLLNYKVNL